MNENDLDEVGNLYLSANQFSNKETILRWTRKNLTDFPKYHLVIEEDKRIIGAISGIILEEKVASIEDIAIHHKYRGLSIGGNLIENLIQYFKQDGIEKVKLWVHWTDARAIPFYYRHGFKIEGYERTKNKPDVPDGEDIILMEKRL